MNLADALAAPRLAPLPPLLAFVVEARQVVRSLQVVLQLRDASAESVSLRLFGQRAAHPARAGDVVLVCGAETREFRRAASLAAPAAARVTVVGSLHARGASGADPLPLPLQKQLRELVAWSAGDPFLRALRVHSAIDIDKADSAGIHNKRKRTSLTDITGKLNIKDPCVDSLQTVMMPSFADAELFTITIQQGNQLHKITATRQALETVIGVSLLMPEDFMLRLRWADRIVQRCSLFQRIEREYQVDDKNRLIAKPESFHQ
ncbi:hypothetical protein BDR26DRAFT_1011273 [Obelidium mucronatum]|nr:hypothetical protein BDR26DRAFT_1011273 [Obelidium mucronatum]